MALPPEKAKQVEQVSALFHAALIQLGLQATEDALTLWEDVPPVPSADGGRAVEKWLSTAVRYVMRRRIRARDLALAYYRYQRALVTGATIALPGQDAPEYMTLPELKREFEAFLNPTTETPAARPVDEVVDQETQAVSEAPTTEPREADAAPEGEDDEGEDDELDRILVEEIDGLEAELEEIEKQAEQEIQSALRELGPKNQDRKIKKIKSTEITEVDAQRKQAHEEAGRRQAASATRVVQNGARSTVFTAGSRDPRVIGFARVSKTGTPCGWCAMLISRGFLPIKGRVDGSNLYRSAQMSSVNVTYGDLDLYHDNCQCYAMPIFDITQMESDELFALNRLYAEQWPTVTKGLGGKSAVSAWRRFIRQQAKSQKSQEAAA